MTVLCSFIFFLLLSLPLSAQEIKGPLSSMSIDKEKESFRNLISTSKTIFIKFTKSQQLKGSEKIFKEDGKIYYQSSPMLFKIELPSEIILIKEKTIERFIPKFNEKYVNSWDGRNPFFQYIDIPDGDVEVKHSSSNVVNITVRRGSETIEICYDKNRNIIKSIRTETPVSVMEIKVKVFKRDVDFGKEVFNLPENCKTVDLRK